MKILIDLDDDTWVKVLDGYVPLGIGKQLKAGIPIDKFLEDINQEIYQKQYDFNTDSAWYRHAIKDCLKIIDKHIGKEQE